MFRRLICLGVLTLALALLFVPLLPMIAHADAVDDWYAAVCGDNGLVFRRIAYIGMAVIGASGLANFKSLLGVPVLGPVINFVALNWRELLTAASNAAGQGKKAIMLLAVSGLGVDLSACAQLGLTGNPIADAPAIRNDLIKGCQDLGPLAAPLAAAPDAGVKAAGVIATYAASVCDGNGNVIPAVVAGLAPDTGAWLQTLLGELQAAQGLTAPAPTAPAAPAKS
jgi:hypothetical protein